MTDNNIQEINISDHIVDNKLKIIAKPNAQKTQVLEFDRRRNAIRIAIGAVPDKDKANTELLKFLKRQTKRQCRLKSGSTSRDKVVEFT